MSQEGEFDLFPYHPTCEGCRYGYLNQLGHMEPGGCLYEDGDEVLTGANAVPLRQRAVSLRQRSATPEIILPLEQDPEK